MSARGYIDDLLHLSVSHSGELQELIGSLGRLVLLTGQRGEVDPPL